MVQGVRQGCGISLDFFNLYSELILQVPENILEDIVVNGVKVNIHYADDPAFITTLHGLRGLRWSVFPRWHKNQPSYSLQIKKPLSKCLHLTILVPWSQQTVEATMKLAWTLNTETHRNIEATEMSFYCCMLKISYLNCVTNKKVLQYLQMEQQLLKVPIEISWAHSERKIWRIVSWR